MSVADVHSAIVAYLQGASLPYVNSTSAVVQFVDKQMPDGELFFPQGTPGLTTGVAIFTWMLSGRENRIAIGPYTPGNPQGQKWVPYKVGLNCFLRCTDPKASVAAANNETFIDALITAIRADRNAGDPGVVFMWGEGDSEHMGGIDIEWTQAEPVVLGDQVAGQVEINTRFTVSACQVLDT